MIEAGILDQGSTLQETRHKNLDIAKEIIFEVLSKSHDEYPE